MRGNLVAWYLEARFCFTGLKQAKEEQGTPRSSEGGRGERERGREGKKEEGWKKGDREGKREGKREGEREKLSE